MSPAAIANAVNTAALLADYRNALETLTAALLEHATLGGHVVAECIERSHTRSQPALQQALAA